MRCPICNQDLLEDKERRFETIGDHVSDPNRTLHPLRPTWVCDNNDCIANGMFFWDDYGDYYISHSMYDTYMKYRGLFKWKSHQELLSARDSTSKKHHREQYHEDKRSRLFKIGKRGWEIHRKVTCNTEGRVVKVRFKLQGFKKHELGWVWA